MAAIANVSNATGSAATAAAAPVSTKALWAGRVLSGLPVLALLLSSSMKLSHASSFVATWQKLGFQESQLTGIGILELLCVAIYLVPRTAALGAILLTGYLGGAIVTHLRAGEPFIAPLLIGVLIWAGLYLREPRLRALVPLR